MGLLQPNFPKAAIGLERDSVTALALEKQGRGRFGIKQAATVTLPDNLLKPNFLEKNISSADELLVLLTEAVQNAGLLKQKRWSVSLPAAAARTAILTLDAEPASKDELTQVLDWKAERSFGAPAGELRISQHKISPDAGGKPHYFATAVKLTVLDEYESAFERMGWKAGLILPRAVLDLPKFGAINVHASLLPAYRGASPITTAILDGRDKTGVSIMLMDVGMDTGPVLTQAEQAIHPDDTTASLSERLDSQGAELLIETLPRWLAGEITPTPQDQLAGEVSLCHLIKKEDGLIDWSQPAAAIERMTRAYTPWPSDYTTWHSEPYKIWRAAVIEGEATPGRVVSPGQGGIAVGTGAGLLLLQSVQPAGKRVLDIRSFLNGAPDFVGAQLGE